MVRALGIVREVRDCMIDSRVVSTNFLIYSSRERETSPIRFNAMIKGYLYEFLPMTTFLESVDSSRYPHFLSFPYFDCYLSLVFFCFSCENTQRKRQENDRIYFEY